MQKSQYITLVREEYVRQMEVYNRHGAVDEHEEGWKSAVFPGYLGIYAATKILDAIEAASCDSGIVPEAIYAIMI